MLMTWRNVNEKTDIQHSAIMKKSTYLCWIHMKKHWFERGDRSQPLCIEWSPSPLISYMRLFSVQLQPASPASSLVSSSSSPFPDVTTKSSYIPYYFQKTPSPNSVPLYTAASLLDGIISSISTKQIPSHPSWASSYISLWEAPSDAPRWS